MDTYRYQPVNNDIRGHKREINRWILFFRQLFICSGAWTLAFISGLGLGAGTILVTQFRKVETVSEEMSAWITCSAFLYVPIWTIILTNLAKHKGRKIAFGVAYAITLLGFIIFYFSASLHHILISEVFKSASFSNNLATIIFIITEYSSPEYRGPFLALKASSITWGIWVSNAIGSFFHWTYVALAAFMCFVYAGTFVFWPNSPLWLASKGRFQECVETHRWLRGTGENAEKELKNLLDTAKCFQKSPEKLSVMTKIKKFFKLIKNQGFYKPLLIVLVVSSQPIASGKLVCTLYAVELLSKVTNDTNKAHTLMLILDGVTVFGMYCGCVMVKFVKRRTILIGGSALGVIFLFILSLYFYLIDMQVLSENSVASIVLLTAFSICIACGPMILCYSVFGELIPTDSRETFTMVASILCVLSHGAYLRIAPYIFNRLSLFVTFLTYAISASLVTFAMFKYLPETKDKTLAEIGRLFNDTKIEEESKHDDREN